MEVLGKTFGAEKYEARNIQEIQTHVQAFGKKVAGTNADASFAICVGVINGRKPTGFDIATHKNGFGQDNWMREIANPDPERPGYALAAAAKPHPPPTRHPSDGLDDLRPSRT